MDFLVYDFTHKHLDDECEECEEEDLVVHFVVMVAVAVVDFFFLISLSNILFFFKGELFESLGKTVNKKIKTSSIYN